ncbi:MAG: glycerate kinase [Chloroflexi bacterium]|nr:glycerate kinase [Chloroflexota bacterium]
MKIAVAPNAFRESMTSVEAANAIAEGLKRSDLDCETVLMPLADGGNGTLEVWQQATGADLIMIETIDPLARRIQAQFGLKGDVALVEMARASGIELLKPDERDPLRTTTYGTGDLIRAAIERGATEILVGLGGSATVDGGAGCLQALGARLMDKWDHPIPYGGGFLNELDHIEPEILQETLEGVTIRVLGDVDNPLLGDNGAAPVFGPQKGADADMVKTLARNLGHFAGVVKRDMGVDIRDMPGSGAAGGIAGGLYGVAGAEIVSGVETLISALGYDDLLAAGDIDLLITGEGKLDSQTKGGKAPLGIANEAKKHGIPVIAVAGSITATPDELKEWGFVNAFSILPKIAELDEALANGPDWLRDTAQRIGDILALGNR